jgi:archaellum component FlaF (FlaF/FlaG flagellin family)
MSFRISKQTGKTTYNLKEFTIDTYDDIKKINTTQLAVGSIVFVIDTSANYMLNSKKAWVEVDIGGGSKNNPDKYDIIYDGGVISATSDSDDDIIYDGGVEEAN